VRGSYWWVNDDINESFRIAALDATYKANYFEPGHGHPLDTGEGVTIMKYINFALDYASAIRGGPATSVVEMGNGGGYYAKQLATMFPASEFLTVEGSGAGVEATLARGLPPAQVKLWDLRLPLFLGRRYDLALNTEVSEHVEPVFSSQIILNLVLHADIIWFSYKDAGPKQPAWINHPNERPRKMWDSLFDFYGYKTYTLPLGVKYSIEERGDLVAYNATKYSLTPDVLLQLDSIWIGCSNGGDDRFECHDQAYCADGFGSPIISYTGGSAPHSRRSFDDCKERCARDTTCKCFDYWPKGIPRPSGAGADWYNHNAQCRLFTKYEKGLTSHGSQAAWGKI
jgi:hypothetical protein